MRASPHRFLFSSGQLSEWLERRKREALAEAASMDPDIVLGTPEADLVERFLKRYRVDPPQLRLHERYTEGAQDVQIDVSHDPRRVVFDRSRPAYVQGTRIVVHVPFDGDPELFDLTPTTRSLNPPRGEVRGGELLVAHELPADDPQVWNLGVYLQKQLDDIQTWLAWTHSDCARFNEELQGELWRAVPARKQKVLQDRNIEAFLGIPVRRRSDASPILRVGIPQRRRLVKPELGKQPVAPFTPEPAISREDYGAILEAVRSFGNAVERFPETFGAMREEVLREVLLVILNNQFGPSGAEMFSRQGKTDILIQHETGAVFIAECKFWKGSKAFRRAVDQLLGYLVWRDTKSALVLFVREGNVTEILGKAEAVMKGHPRFKRVAQSVAGSPVYVLHHQGDADREIQIALVAVPVPPVPPKPDGDEAEGG